MKTIKQSYQIKAPIDKVWQALVDPKEIDSWGAGVAEMDDRVGTEFKLWGGDVFGKNIEVVQGEKLVQEWSDGELEKGTKVTFTLTKNDDKTQVDLLQEDVPPDRVADLEDGWKRYYLGPMKTYLEREN